jgi:1,4-dihydroxy-2-naphthoate octaprenyltransferase
MGDGMHAAIAGTTDQPRASGQVAEGIWRLTDPKITLASVASMVLGAGAAAHDGPIRWGWLALTVLGVFGVEVGKNASGEVVDFDSGTDLAVAARDRTPFSGGKRVLVEGLLTRAQTIAVAAAGYSVALAAGLAIVLLRDPRVLWLGLAGVAGAFFYHAPPLKLSYRGWGELAVALCYGPLIASGTYLVQRGSVSPALLALSVPLGGLVASFLWINEFPDFEADRAANKRTLVVRLGRVAASRVFAWIVALSYLGLAALPLAGVPWTVLLGLAGLPFGAAAAVRLARDPRDTPRIVPAQAWTLLSFFSMAAGSALGLLFAR